MKNKIRALFLCLSLCFITVFSGCQNAVKPLEIIKETGAETAFKPVEYEKMGNHTYYQSDIFKSTDMEEYKKENIIPLIEEADKSLDEDVLLTNFYISLASGQMTLYGFIMSEGVIYQELNICAEKNDNSVYVWNIEKYKDVTIPQKGTLMDAKDFYDDVYALAENHKSEMFINGMEQPISGEYYVQGRLDGSIFYDFRINYNSAVWVEAHTGEIIHTYFFNGIYT
jgi:hypothetical protein